MRTMRRSRQRRGGITASGDKRGALGLPAVVAAALTLTGAARADNDHLIVPWQRVGPITLGMSTAELVHAMGEPTRTMGGPPHTFSVYYWREDLSATISKDGDFVTQVCALSPAYGTAEGVRPGSTDAAVTALLGEPQSSRLYKSWWRMSYTNLSWGGLMISIPLTGFSNNHVVRTVCVNHNA